MSGGLCRVCKLTNNTWPLDEGCRLIRMSAEVVVVSFTFVRPGLRSRTLVRSGCMHVTMGRVQKVQWRRLPRLRHLLIPVSLTRLSAGRLVRALLLLQYDHKNSISPTNRMDDTVPCWTFRSLLALLDRYGNSRPRCLSPTTTVHHSPWCGRHCSTTLSPPLLFFLGSVPAAFTLV